MCGIAGMIGARPVPEAALATMRDRLAHRGPDDHGSWMSPDGLVALGHRRLSIIDLSPLGHQPMASASDRYVLVYNGELYNHLELRRSLEAEGRAPAWRGHSDTETLLAAIDAWGLVEALQRSTGMFGLALWDRRDQRLSLARDRFGEKPLYYGWAAGMFVFASEIGAIRALPGFDNQIARSSIAALLSRSYIPAPASIYRGIFKLEPGCVLTVDRDVASRMQDAPILADGDPRIVRYWRYGDVLAAGRRDPFRDPVEAEQAVEAALSAAIADQSVADVPVGAFLSGGIDSSTIVALYQAQAARSIRTFSIGFSEAGFDEAVYARDVAARLGTDHSELYVDAADALAVIPDLPTMYGEPFADPSAIPTHIVSRFARGDVTVALSGDAGDELFGGYNRYVAIPRLWGRARALTPPLRRLIAGGAARIPASAWNHGARLATGHARPPFFGAKIRKTLATVARANQLQDLMADFLDAWDMRPLPVLGDHGRPGLPDPAAFADDAATSLMYIDALTYLPDDILAKVDRAAMAVSLETRVPFLDPRVAAVAARLPMEMKIAGGSTKRMLRAILARHIPMSLIDRPKAGFAIPIDSWLRGPLRDWAQDLLDPRRLRDDGWLDAGAVGKVWQDHLRGGSDQSGRLWPVLMFQAWVRQQS